MTYLEIHAIGGSILQTVRDTRKATEDEILAYSKEIMDSMLKHGATTAEAKSGYGLNVESEAKCLNVIRKLNGRHPVDIVSTFLGAHAFPPECDGRPQDYVNLVIETMIPRIADLQLAEFCDVACERGFFGPQQSKAILQARRYY